MDTQSEQVVESTNEQLVVPETVDLNSLSLDKVSIHHTYLLEKASIGQIMKRVANLGIKDPRNTYQRILNEHFEAAVPKLVNAYAEILNCSTPEEFVVKDFNLLGNLPKDVSIDTSIKKSHNLYQASIGDILNALRQRIDFISKRDVPKFYTENSVYIEPFKNMQQQILELIPHVNEFEDGFTKAIDKAMKLKRVKNQ